MRTYPPLVVSTIAAILFFSAATMTINANTERKDGMQIEVAEGKKNDKIGKVLNIGKIRGNKHNFKRALCLGG